MARYGRGLHPLKFARHLHSPLPPPTLGRKSIRALARADPLPSPLQHPSRWKAANKAPIRQTTNKAPEVNCTLLDGPSLASLLPPSFLLITRPSSLPHSTRTAPVDGGKPERGNIMLNETKFIITKFASAISASTTFMFPQSIERWPTATGISYKPHGHWEQWFLKASGVYNLQKSREKGEEKVREEGYNRLTLQESCTHHTRCPASTTNRSWLPCPCSRNHWRQGIKGFIRPTTGFLRRDFDPTTVFFERDM